MIYVRDNPLFDRLTFTIFIFKDINNEYVFLVYPNLLISESTISALSIKYDKEPQRAMRDSTTNVESVSIFYRNKSFFNPLLLSLSWPCFTLRRSCLPKVWLFNLHIQLFTFKRIPTAPVPQHSVLCEECEEFTAQTVR